MDILESSPRLGHEGADGLGYSCRVLSVADPTTRNVKLDHCKATFRANWCQLIGARSLRRTLLRLKSLLQNVV